jgi:hypothetical protein
VYYLLTNKNDEVQPANQINYGNCNITLAPNQSKILGDKCKIEGFVTWKPLGNDAVQASDKMRLVRFLTELPSADFIPELATIDQLFEWVNLKNNCIDIAKCWLAGHELPDNPLAGYQMEGMDSGKAYHDYIWLSAKFFENLWELAEQKYGKIKSSFVKQRWKYPFNGPRPFIEEIFANYINSEFAPHLKDGHQVKVGDSRLISDLGRKHVKGDDLSEKEQKKLDDLVTRYGQPHVLLNQLNDVVRGLAKKDKFISARLNINKDLMLGIFQLQQDAARKPGLKAAGLQDAYIYINGFKTPLPKRRKLKREL